MSLGLGLLSFGLDALKTLGSHKAAKAKAKSDREWQAYNNKMVRINDALNQNTITTNDNMRRERVHMQKQQIQRSQLAVSAKVETSAAATGTVGRSVNMTLFDVQRNASDAVSMIDRDDQHQQLQSDNQRMLSTFQAESSIDLRSIPSPSSASLMLGLAGNALQHRDSLSSAWGAMKSRF